MALLFIHKASCISPQQTFDEVQLDEVKHPEHNKLEVNEPVYKGIPAGALRRMGKAIRMGVGAAMPLIKEDAPNGIIIGTANGGMEDCIKFLNQIIEYDEGMLTPGNFVGSTPNAIAAQLGLVTKNKHYNITHVQSGLSFENALLDAAMMLHEQPGHQYLVGGVDEISDYNYNIDWLSGWYKKEDYAGDFYEANSAGSLAGEGSAMFMVNAKKEEALVGIDAMHFFHATDAEEISNELSTFLTRNLGDDVPDIFLTGENGDSRFLSYYNSCEALFPESTTVARYKHFTGEYPTSSAIAVWLAIQFLKAGLIPAHFIKKQGIVKPPVSAVIYNHYKACQHSFMLLSRPY